MFDSILAVDYLYAIVPEDFLNASKPLDIAPYYGSETDQYTPTWERLKGQATNGILQRHEDIDCITAFGTTFVTLQ